MEAARLPGASSRPNSYRLSLIGGLIGLAALAWAATDERMAGMDHGPGTELGSFGFFVTVWVMMMAAMMFPSVAPTVLTYAKVQAGREARGADRVGGGTLALIAGYLLSWCAAGVVGYLTFEAISAIEIDALAWDEAGPYVAGGVIVAAAVYQLTPLKDTCLRHCRSPLAFLLHRWRDGLGGALRMGAEHGAYCVGCCWMLMAALFALGVMSIGWMALIAALIAIEKLLPWKRVANLGIAILLACLGVAVALAPGDVPGLTIPHSSAAQHRMGGAHKESGGMGHSPAGRMEMDRGGRDSGPSSRPAGPMDP